MTITMSEELRAAHLKFNLRPDFNLNASSEKRISVYIRLLDANSKGMYAADSYTTVHVLGQPHLKQLTANPCSTAAGKTPKIWFP